MIRQINNETSKRLLIGSLFIVFFLYFGFFNKYHILYLEQNQLFLFNLDFIKEQFSLPGGLPLYIGSFFTQFFISSWVGAFIFTLNAFAVFVLSDYINKKHNLKNIISALVPVWLLAILQSNELFTFGQSMGFLLLVSFFALYISISKSAFRYIFYFAGWPFLYLLTGGYSVPAVLLCALHELLFRKQKNHHIIFVLFIITGVLVPYVSAHLIFYIPGNKIFTYPVLFELHSYSLYALILLLVWNPLLLLVNYFLNKINSIKNRLLPWNRTNVLASALIFALMGFGVYKYAYNKRAEIMLGIDHHVQQAEWGKVLKLSDRYPDLNTLVIYYTNLALYKTGRMSDKMFSYSQIGANGLRLRWERNSNLFFGGEIFYYLSYTNEAYRWAFEAMVAKGLNPRSLKRLVITSITNGDSAIAKKYIHLLNQTLFYRQWAQHYNTYLSDPALAENDPEISRNRDLLIHSDFISNANDMNLDDLLINHPENKMAYEYLMASLLLEKNLDEFARIILVIKDYGYTRMPVHFEEALIFYNSYENKNIMPEGFSFRPETIRRFQDYAKTYTTYRNNPAVAAKELKKRYGKTYWFYLQFINNKQ
ncbi:MAG: DUF6057 family protein [Bacteroidales bacterium]|nr:DUF6057 family protein [Bacteroidales bacterium]MDP3003804.1 DUF6057 family protein [Bacteroidales bacterium]